MLERAQAAGVKRSGHRQRTSRRIAWTPLFRSRRSTTGFTRRSASIRTTRAQRTEEHFAQLDELARNPRVIAWGEMGLDYHYEHSPREVQQHGVSPPIAAGARSETADRDSLPRRVGRLPGDPGKRLEAGRTGRNFSLLHRHAATKRSAAWTWVSWFRSRETSLTPKRSICATWRATCRSSESSRKRIRLFFRPRAAAANATSRPTWWR